MRVALWWPTVVDGTDPPLKTCNTLFVYISVLTRKLIQESFRVGFILQGDYSISNWKNEQNQNPWSYCAAMLVAIYASVTKFATAWTSVRICWNIVQCCTRGPNDPHAWLFHPALYAGPGLIKGQRIFKYPWIGT